MPSPSLRRKIVVLLLGAVLTVSWSLAAAPRHVVPSHAVVASPAPAPFLGRLWTFLTSVWGTEGCRIDPDGRCVASPSPGLAKPAETGCRIDPDGCLTTRTASPVSPAEEGCHLDPDGRCGW